MSERPVGLPVIGLRLAEGRSGSTLLMQLLATAPDVVFDDRYPAEYRFLSYFARISSLISEPFSEADHPGVTEFFFGDGQRWGPVPFDSDLVDVRQLDGPMLGAMWQAWSDQVIAGRPAARFYAEKLAVPVETIADAGIDLRVIDLVRDPRDVLASIRAFTARGIEGFGRRAGKSEDDYVEEFVARLAAGYRTMLTTPPAVPTLLVRYEDLVADLHRSAAQLEAWLGIRLAPDAVLRQRGDYAHHITSDSPATSIGRWRDDLDPAEAAELTEAFGSTLAALGYPA